MKQYRQFFFVFFFLPFFFQSCDECISCDDHQEGLIVLKPNAKNGEDAVIWTERPDVPRPDDKDFQAMGWTWYAYDFDEGIRRSLINFDLECVPEGAEITSATLNLFFNPQSAEIPSTFGHSQRDGSNESLLSRITSPWSEKSVTWNNQPSVTQENQVVVRASIDPEENYNIDVTDLVVDMLDNPSDSYGFMFQLRNENFYRAMIFASSDHENSNLHPELIIEYESN